MCLSPKLIPNPNRGMQNIGLAYLKETTPAYIRIPCGHCAECIASRQMSMVQRAEIENRYNHVFMVTLTYNNEMLPRLTLSDGTELAFPNKHDIQNMFKRIRKINPVGRDIKYIAAPEYGSETHRPHFHLLLFVSKKETDDFFKIQEIYEKLRACVFDNWSRNIGTRKNPIYKNCCTFHQKIYKNGKKSYNYQFDLVTPRDGKKANSPEYYVTKYLFKADSWLDKLYAELKYDHELADGEFEAAWKLLKPLAMYSKGFGLNAHIRGRGTSRKLEVDPALVDRLHHEVERNKREYPFPTIPDPEGTLRPLGRYYRKVPGIYTFDLAEWFFHMQADEHYEVFHIQKEYNLNNIKDKEAKFRNRQSLSQALHNDSYLDEIYSDEVQPNLSSNNESSQCYSSGQSDKLGSAYSDRSQVDFQFVPEDFEHDALRGHNSALRSGLNSGRPLQPEVIPRPQRVHLEGSFDGLYQDE